MVLEIISTLLGVILLAVIINGLEDYYRQKKKSMSFRESMDLTDLPIVTFYNNGRKFNFLLDTGATMSVIDSNALNNLKYIKSEDSGTLFGMEGTKIDVSYIKAFLKYKEEEYEEEFQVVDMSAAFGQIKTESGVNLSGILGSLFFRRYQYVLDFESLIAYSKK